MGPCASRSVALTTAPTYGTTHPSVIEVIMSESYHDGISKRELPGDIKLNLETLNGVQRRIVVALQATKRKKEFAEVNFTKILLKFQTINKTLQQVKQIFVQVDSENLGTLSVSQIDIVLTKLKSEIHSSELHDFFETAKVEGNGSNSDPPSSPNPNKYTNNNTTNGHDSDNDSIGSEPNSPNIANLRLNQKEFLVALCICYVLRAIPALATPAARRMSIDLYGEHDGASTPNRERGSSMGGSFAGSRIRGSSIGGRFKGGPKGFFKEKNLDSRPSEASLIADEASQIGSQVAVVVGSGNMKHPHQHPHYSQHSPMNNSSNSPSQPGLRGRKNSVTGLFNNSQKNDSLKASFALMVHAYLLFDKDAKGYIAQSDVAQIMKEDGLGGKEGQGFLQEDRIKEMDFTKSGVVEFQEFIYTFSRWVDTEED